MLTVSISIKYFCPNIFSRDSDLRTSFQVVDILFWVVDILSKVVDILKKLWIYCYILKNYVENIYCFTFQKYNQQYMTTVIALIFKRFEKYFTLNKLILFKEELSKIDLRSTSREAICTRFCTLLDNFFTRSIWVSSPYIRFIIFNFHPSIIFNYFHAGSKPFRGYSLISDCFA